MKKIILASLIALIATIGIQAQTALPVLNMENGSKSLDQGSCWAFGSVSYSNLEFRIAGFWSGRTNQLTNSSITSCWIKTPWILPTTGNITLKARLENSSGTSRGIVVSYIPYDAGSASIYKEGATTSFYTYTFPTPLSIDIRSITLPIPSAIQNSTTPYKILISFVGSGGNSRAFVDDISIPATYYSDPLNSCLPITPAVKDKDGDGVADADDQYPDDETRAFNTTLVKESTLMFEDLWPSTGDFDFNDLVTKYDALAVTNADNNLVEIILNVELRAIGASFNNGLIFQLDNIDPKSIVSVDGNSLNKAEWLNIADNGTENEQKYANIVIFDQAKMVLPSPGGSGVNVNPENPYVKPEVLKVVISFDAKDKEYNVSLKDIRLNPYIIVNQKREVEVHLPDYIPSSLASEKLFGSSKDDTNLEKGKYYKTKNNLPFALQVEGDVPHMIEKQDILTGYLMLEDWIKSEGNANEDWYKETEKGYRNDKFLFYMK
ncbi:MAG: LruC domain-containing protein [Bacteroidia bacterium]|nr:LruC domain-containing protein [Bacteroidia bacterium]MCF8445687.1 LruC domain-containing protein [Bacteroidia bacterium]